MNDAEKLKNVISVIFDGGVTALEITMTAPEAIVLIKEISENV